MLNFQITQKTFFLGCYAILGLSFSTCFLPLLYLSGDMGFRVAVFNFIPFVIGALLLWFFYHKSIVEMKFDIRSTWLIPLGVYALKALLGGLFNLSVPAARVFILPWAAFWVFLPHYLYVCATEGSGWQLFKRYVVWIAIIDLIPLLSVLIDSYLKNSMENMPSYSMTYLFAGIPYILFFCGFSWFVKQPMSQIGLNIDKSWKLELINIFSLIVGFIFCATFFLTM